MITNHPFADPMFQAALDEVQAQHELPWTEAIETGWTFCTRRSTTRITMPRRLRLARLQSGYELAYVPKWSCFVLGWPSTGEHVRRALIEHASIIQTWAESMALDMNCWGDMPHHARKRYTLPWAARWLKWRLGRIQDMFGDPTDLKIQRAAFSTYGQVPPQMYTAQSLIGYVSSLDPDANSDYIVSDYLRMRWFRLVLDPRARRDDVAKVRECAGSSAAVRKSLAQIPARLTNQIVAAAAEHLAGLDRPQPLEGRTEWIAAALANFDYGGRPYLEVVQRASPYQIRKAMAIAREALHGVDTRSLRSRRMALRWIFDVHDADADALDFDKPGPRSSLVTWARASERYHRNLDQVRREQQRVRMERDAEAFARLRAIKVEGLKGLPEGFRQLTTYDEVVSEGELMDHCVAGYAVSVVEGHTIILAYEEGPRPEERATIQVHPDGDRLRVYQCYGPGNSITPVSQRARRKLSRYRIPGETKVSEEDRERAGLDRPLPF